MSEYEPIDWSDPNTRPMNEHGSKAQVGEGAAGQNAYSIWRRTVGKGCYAGDVDWIEWRAVSGRLIPVAIIETTFYDDLPEWRHKLPKYRTAALTRFKRDAQHTGVMYLAEKLNIPAYFAVIRKDLGWFMVCRLEDDLWAEMDEPQYRTWIEGLYLDLVEARKLCASSPSVTATSENTLKATQTPPQDSTPAS